jgi:tripartite-type tricarboxylate transporter receptor subunit TctC
MLHHFAIAAAALAAIFTNALPVAAQDYPKRPITLVVPFPAGGGNDALARVVAEKMSRTLGQQVVVENRGGAGGTIATRAVAKARPTATPSCSPIPARSVSIRRSIPMPDTIHARTSPRSG